jgi:hypothetical protein
MRKIPAEFENPFDSLLLELCDKVKGTFKKYNFTPNHITTISLIVTILAGLLLYNTQYYIASFLIIVGYFFDCLDGHYARSYKMETKFGDYYDHFGDLFKLVFLYCIFYIMDKNKFWKIFIILLIFGFLALVHIGCQEIYYSVNNNIETEDTLKFNKFLCPIKNNKFEKIFSITKYIGGGTFYLVLALVPIYYKFYS